MVKLTIKIVLLTLIAMIVLAIIGSQIEESGPLSNWIRSNKLAFDIWGYSLYATVFLAWPYICEFHAKKYNYNGKQLKEIKNKRYFVIICLIAFDLAFVQGYLSELVFWVIE